MDLSPFWIIDNLVDPAAGTVSREGAVSHLRPRSMELLVTLALNAGRVISRQDAKRLLWQQDYVEEAAISQCIYEIRSVLGVKARAQKAIVTVPKRGYVLTVTPRADPAATATMGPGLLETPSLQALREPASARRPPSVVLHWHPSPSAPVGDAPPLLIELPALLQQSGQVNSVSVAPTAPNPAGTNGTIESASCDADVGVDIRTRMSAPPDQSIQVSLALQDCRTTGTLGAVQVEAQSDSPGALARAAAAACVEILSLWAPADSPDS